MEQIRILINKLFGKVESEKHIVTWRRKMTIDGIFWERVHSIETEK